MIGSTYKRFGWQERERERKSMAAMATKRVCLYSSFHFLEDFFFWSERWGYTRDFQPATKSQAKNFQHNANHASKVTVDAYSTALLRPTISFFHLYFIKFSCVVSKCNSRKFPQKKKKKWRKPAFLRLVVSYMWCAEIAAVSCCYCRSRFAGWPRPQQPNPQSRKENGNCCAFSSHDFDDPKLETTLPPRNT